MVSPTYPGVYIQEVSSGVRPIASASTSTAAFVGEAERGDTEEAVRIFNFTEFQNLYGAFLEGRYLAHSVFQFFNNGGSICYIVRVAASDVTTADIQIGNQDSGGTEQALLISAASPGSWGNSLTLAISPGTNDPENEFNLDVFEDSLPRAVETYENLSMFEDASNFVERVVNRSFRIQVSASSALENIMGQLRGTVVPPDFSGSPLAQTLLRLQINDDEPREIDLLDAAITLDSLTNIVSAINTLVNALLPVSGSVPAQAYANFVASVDPIDGVVVLTSGAPGADSSVVALAATTPANDASIILLGSSRGMAITAAAGARPVFNDGSVPHYLVGDHNVTGTDAVIAVTAGSDGSPAEQAELATDTPYLEALNRLNDKDDVSLIAIPGIGSPALFGSATNYCENTRSLSDCFFIGDMPPDIEVNDIQTDFVAPISPKNSYGAVYYPWLNMLDPTGASIDPIMVPSSGFVAGLYAKTDFQRGVWKAPAGTEAAIAGSTGLVNTVTDVQQGVLNPINVNVIRSFPASGRVIWGARTITSDPEWRYVPVRRMAIFLRVSIYNGIQWAVFEPNDEPLWNNLKLNIEAFMTTQFRRGAFQGATASDAFFVKVDSETTTQTDIDNGIVNIRVGFAPLKPAEFIIVELSQKAGQ